MIETTITFIQELFAGLVTQLIVAAIIILIGFILGKALNRVIKKGLKEIGLNSMMREIGIKAPLEEIFSHGVMYSIYFIATIMALRHIGIATDILNIISIMVIAFIGIFILLSVKDFIPNVISGIVLHQKGTIKEHDSIEINKITGTVTEMNLLETKLVTKKGDIIIVPNANLTKSAIVKKKIKPIKKQETKKQKKKLTKKVTTKSPIKHV